MGYIISANPALIRRTAEINQGILNKLNIKLNELKAAKSQLDSSWEGTASDVYRNDLMCKISFFEENNEYLHKIIEFEQIAGDEYSKAEECVRNIVSSM